MSEPQHIKEILPGVTQNIARRVNRYRETHNLPKLREEIGENEHRAGVLAAVKDFHEHNERGAHSRRNERPKQEKDKKSGKDSV